MKKTIVWLLVAAALISLAGCASKPAADIPDLQSVTSAPQATEEPQAPAETEAPAETQAPEETEAPKQGSGKKEGERYDGKITIEGFEETVKYEHIVNEDIGFEMDYDFETFVRHIEKDYEMFILRYDDDKDPKDYIKVERRDGDVESVVAALMDEYSADYVPERREYDLETAGKCAEIDASINKDGVLSDLIQYVYVIPSGDHCIVATASYLIDGSDGFGRRLSLMINTIWVP